MNDLRREQELRRFFCGAAAVLGLLACAGDRAVREPAPGPGPEARGTPLQASPATAVYVVREGESLAALARCSGVTVAVLARDNGIPDPNRVFAGEKLRLPAAHHCGGTPLPARQAPTHVRARNLLSQAVAALDAADFDLALTRAGQCVDDVAKASDAKAKELGARCHVAAATAATGLDRRELALAELRSALVLEPDLELTPEDASPRVRELLEVARASPHGATN